MNKPAPLPPAFRTPLWRHVTKGARSGQLMLQHCIDCGTVQYPPREVCGHCLSPALEWRDTDGRGRVLTLTRLHASVKPWFQDRLPVTVALVQLDCGPVLYAFAADEITPGARVRVRAEVDAADVAVLRAKQMNGEEQE